MHRLFAAAERWLVAALVLWGVQAPAGWSYAQQTGSAAPSSESAEPPLQVEIVGNRVLVDSVLMWVMDLPEHGPATAEMAAEVEGRLRGFFAQTGYDLARVRVVAKDGVLHVFVDEGKLDKIFLTGTGSSQALRFQVGLRLPGNVYNSKRIAEELDRIEKKYGLSDLRAQLIVLEPEPETIFQLEEYLDALEGDRERLDGVWRESRGRYALRVHHVSDEWGDGLSYGANYLLPYGLNTYAGYADTDVFADDDRARVSLEVAGLREKFLTQAGAELFWATPPLGAVWIRPELDLRAQLESFDRESLGVLEYYQLEGSGVGRFGVEPYENLVVSIGFGYGYEKLFALELADDAPAYLEPLTRQYPLGRVDMEWLISTRGFRRDKYHQLDVEFETFHVDQGLVRRATLDYQNVWEFGYQDLIWRVAGLSVTGQGARWLDEEPIASSILRSVAGQEEFARNMGQMGLEFRLSLYRDILKASLSGGAAVAGLLERDERDQFIDFFASGGPGIHVLLLDNFQLDAYYSVGWREGAPLNQRFSFSVNKVF